MYIYIILIPMGIPWGA